MLNDNLVSQPVKRQTLAEQMADTIKALILTNQLEAGSSLPTEPNLAQQFGVSRAVVRDATRILMAWGLVEVKHGRGVFVTASQNEAFGEALLLTLQRAGATVWDVEQFEQIIWPEVLALAAQNVTDEELAIIQQLADNYIVLFSTHVDTWWGQNTPQHVLGPLLASYQNMALAIFAATHNRVFEQLALPLMRLRNMRNWQDAEDDTPAKTVEREADFLKAMIATVSSRDANVTRSTVSQLMVLPPEAIKAMQQTPVGEVPQIPITQQGS